MAKTMLAADETPDNFWPSPVQLYAYVRYGFYIENCESKVPRRQSATALRVTRTRAVPSGAVQEDAIAK